MRYGLFVFGLALLGYGAFSYAPLSASVANVISALDTHGAACLNEVVKLHQNATAVESILTKADLNDDGTDDRIIKLIDEGSCGTSGCIHELCIRQQGNSVELIPFGYAANDITVTGTKTNGFYDLRLNSTINLSWDGNRYQF